MALSNYDSSTSLVRIFQRSRRLQNSSKIMYGPELLKKKKLVSLTYIKFPDERIERTEKMLRGQLS